MLRAFRLLQKYAPEEWLHLAHEIDLIAVGNCGPGTLACTGADLGRMILLSVPPADRDLVDLAVTLSHEARHHATDIYTGEHCIIQHTCVDCSDPFERALDPIYARDEQVRRKLLLGQMRDRRARSKAAIGLGFVGLAGLLLFGDSPR